MDCRSPGCPKEAEEGVKWCIEHQALFDRLRTELDDGKDERRRSAGIRRSRRRWPACTMFECNTPAKPGASLCLYHLRRAGAA